MLPSSPITLNDQADDLRTAPSGDTDTRDQSALLQAFLATAQHFFGGFVQMVAPLTDPRRPEFIVYPLAALLFAGVLMYACRLGAQRQIVTCSARMGPRRPSSRRCFKLRPVRTATP